MDLVFRGSPGDLEATVLSRVNGQEMPIINNISFDGTVLRLQMVAPPGKDQAEMPALVMRPAGSRFEGYWMRTATEPMGPPVALIRARV